MTGPDGRPIPLAQPDISARERELVLQVLDSDTLALGPMADAFEERIAAISGRRYAVSCSSGTAGLHMIVSALGIGSGDEVITTPFSFVASANCIVYEGAIPRFVDIEEQTLGLDPELVEAAAGPATRAILPVHIFGQPCRIEALADISAAHDWSLIEDSCEALGTRVGTRSAGSFGDASVFAFYPNKQITTGEGGMVVTDDEDIANVCRSLRNQGRDMDSTWLRHVRLGYNYRMDELSAAVGLAQIERLDELRTKRREVAAAYAAALDDSELVHVPPPSSDGSIDWFVYVVRLDPSVDRDAVMRDLAASGIPARPYFQPLHLQPLYVDLLGHKPGDFPVTERVAASTLALPWSTRLSANEVEFVAEHLIVAAENNRAMR
jgi:perosamine synthetase